jgi:hypothetical protein
VVMASGQRHVEVQVHQTSLDFHGPPLT